MYKLIELQKGYGYVLAPQCRNPIVINV